MFDPKFSQEVTEALADKTDELPASEEAPAEAIRNLWTTWLTMTTLAYSLGIPARMLCEAAEEIGDRGEAYTERTGTPVGGRQEQPA